MKVSTEQIEGRRVVLNVEVDSESLERSLERAYRRIVQKANIPGFRRGKAPRAMVERLLGREVILDEALEQLIPDAYRQAVQENDIDPVAQPQIELVQREPVIFKATVPVSPLVELGDYSQLSFNIDPIEVSETEVDTALEDLRSIYAVWEPVERPVEFGDRVTLDVAGRLGERDLINDSEVTYPVIQGFPVPVAGFPEQLVGIDPGGEKEFSLPMPEDHDDPTLAGQDVSFHVLVKEVKEKKLPELDDEFAKTVRDPTDTLEQLREKMRDNIRANAEQEALRQMEEQVVDAVVGIANIDYPEILVEHEVNHLIEDQISANRDSQGRVDEYLQSIGKSEEEFREEWRPAAFKKVMRSIVLSKVAEVESIEVTAEDIEAEIDRLSGGAGESALGLRTLLNSEAGRDTIGRNLMGRKTLQRLMDVVTGRGAQNPETKEDEPSSHEEGSDSEAAPPEKEGTES
ncbi:MAG: Trigger factor [Dehalococcoidia bacterium]|nr:Trigger factor [Dehalococcoidia bacterium]